MSTDHTTNTSYRKTWKKLGFTLLIFLVLTITGTGLLLKYGIRLDSLTFGGLSITNFELIWKEKLELGADRVILDSEHLFTGSDNGLEMAGRIIDRSIWATQIFSRLDIGSLIIEQTGETVEVSLVTEQEPWRLTAKGPGFIINLALYHRENSLDIDLQKLTIARFDSSAKGHFTVDLQKRQITGGITGTVAGTLPVQADLFMDDRRIGINARGLKKIGAIDKIIALFPIDDEILPWIVEYLQGSSFDLHSLSINLPWSQPELFLDNLVGKVVIDDCQYTFAEGFEPIKTTDTHVLFSKGVLTITPHGSTFYGQSAETSWLNINFNDVNNILLTTYITTHARLTEELLALLRYYDIDLPFIQTAGTTAADLTLRINLNTEDVDGTGTFDVTDSTIRWSNREYQVDGGRVALNNSDIGLENLRIHSAQWLSGELTGAFNVAEETGSVHFTVDTISVEAAGRKLRPVDTKLKTTLTFTPKGYLVEVPPSSWKWGDFPLQIAGLKAPYNMETYSLAIPPLVLSSPGKLKATLSGEVNTDTGMTNLSCELTELNTARVQLTSTPFQLRLNYAQSWHGSTETGSQWLFDATPFTTGAASFRQDEDGFDISVENPEIGKLSATKLTGTLTRDRPSPFFLEGLRIGETGIGDLEPAIQNVPDGLHVDIDNLSLKIRLSEKTGMHLTVSELGPLADRLPLLSTLGLHKGSLEASSISASEGFTFTADIEEPLPLLMRGESPIPRYSVTGSGNFDSIEAEIDVGARFTYDGDYHIEATGVDFNIPEIVNLVQQLQRPSDNNQFTLHLSAEDTGLYLLKNSTAPADSIVLNHTDGKSKIKLTHEDGTVDMSMEGDTFRLSGKNLGSNFLNGLARNADFRGGFMNMVAHGSFDNFAAIIQVRNVVLESYTTLSKMLAFLNTVPALATFSLPKFGTKGLPVTSAVLGGRIKKGRINIKSFDLKSPQLTMSGTGWLDLPKDQMDMELNLITQAKSNLSKIPLIGYIMVGKRELPSITVKVTGDPRDPVVKNSMFKEITTMPFSMLYRTLTLPYTVVEPMVDSMKDMEVPEKELLDLNWGEIENK